MFKFEHLKESIAVFISNAISDHEMSFEIKHSIKHNLRLKLWKSWVSTHFTRMLTKKRVYVDEERLESFMMEVPIIQKPVSMERFLYGKKLRHEKVNALLLACIHWDKFLECDKIIDIYASKYERRMLLINPLSKN